MPRSVLPFCLALMALVVPAENARAAAAKVRTSATTSVSTRRNVHVDANQNVHVSQTTNVNVNRNVDVDVDVHHHVGCCYHPVATPAAVAATVVIGSIVHSLPASCTAVQVNGVLFQQCGSTWYQPQFHGTSVTYVVVVAPR